MTDEGNLVAIRAEQDEWNLIRDELIAAGLKPSAFDVSEEQRKRMTSRGEQSHVEAFVLAVEIMDT